MLLLFWFTISSKRNIMNIFELSFEYLHKLADQTMFISALLGGFSIAVIVFLMNSKETNRISRNLFKAAIIAAASFLVSIFAMTKIVLMTSPGFPFKVTTEDLELPKAIGLTAFLVCIICLMVIISLSGWTKSRGMGIFTSIVGVAGLILIFLML
ncbi:MAG: hypothetical protein ACI9VN_002625 [Patescibacteria group bacterium]|jgi:hypothetical protein